MSIASELARFVTGTRVTDLPPLALERARMVIASTIASAAMGVDIVSSRIIRELAKERGGPPEATLWFDGGAALPVADAARVNAVMSDAAASDDSDLRSIAQIGTVVSTVAIAMAERTGASGRDVLAAMALGMRSRDASTRRSRQDAASVGSTARSPRSLAARWRPARSSSSRRHR
jgi:2-methylcitrate dehydratase PrpD